MRTIHPSFRTYNLALGDYLFDVHFRYLVDCLDITRDSLSTRNSDIGVHHLQSFDVGLVLNNHHRAVVAGAPLNNVEPEFRITVCRATSKHGHGQLTSGFSIRDSRATSNVALEVARAVIVTRPSTNLVGIAAKQKYVSSRQTEWKKPRDESND